MQMAEYIDREALLEAISKIDGSPLSEWDTVGVVSLVANQPAADVAPVRRGYWKSKVNPQWKAYSHDECSICGWWNTRNAMCYDGNHKPGHSLNYCPNCGAKMEAEHDKRGSD